MYPELLRIIHKILAENGETRTLRILNIVNRTNYKIRVPEPLVFDYETVNCYARISVSLTRGDTFTIDWGNGDTELFRSPDYTVPAVFENDDIPIIYCSGNDIGPFQHGSSYLLRPSKRYEKGRIYRVKIYDDRKGGLRIYFLSLWAWRIKKIITLGDIGISDLSSMFYYSDFNGIISPNWDVSKITKMNRMFSYSHFSGKIPLNWDVSNVLEMKGMFEGCNTFKQQRLNWEFHPNVKNDDMFKNTDREGEETGQHISAKTQKIIGSIIKYSTFIINNIVLYRLCKYYFN